MRIDNEVFLAEVEKLYLRDPCRVSAIAFWKLARMCRAAKVYQVRRAGHTYLYAQRGRRLEFYWSDDFETFLLAHAEMDALEFMVLHTDYYKLIAGRLSSFQVRESHPLRYDFSYRPGDVQVGTFRVANFDFEHQGEFERAAGILNLCYGVDGHSAAEVAGWRRLPAFDGSLWIWVCDRHSGEAVGLAISTFQADIRECYLDWVQVLPAYQGRGLGRLLVAETIRRAAPRSDIIRVTGTADDFYRKCGFAGSERWHIIRRRQSG